MEPEMDETTDTIPSRTRPLWQWAALKETADWAVAAARAGQKWEHEQPLTEAEFDAGIHQATTFTIG